MISSLVVMSVGNLAQAAAIHEVALALAFVTGGTLLIYLVWLLVVQWREGRIERRKAIKEGTASEEDARLDKKSALVLFGILGVYLVIVLVVAPLATKSS
ncbi:MAG: hypothetical protein RR772_11800 [Gordonibacter sp.]